jgi:hypothetical protein
MFNSIPIPLRPQQPIADFPMYARTTSCHEHPWFSDLTILLEIAGDGQL